MGRIIPPETRYVITGVLDDTVLRYLFESDRKDILYINEPIDLKDIMISYKLENRRIAEIKTYREKKLEDETKQREAFKKALRKAELAIITAPTNPWKKIAKPASSTVGALASKGN